MNIHILVIPREEHRPEVDGCDWWWDANGDLQVRVSPMSDWRREILLALHETVEAVMCRHNGVTVEQVDAFDAEYDKTHPVDIMAGDEPAAPYAREHCLAEAIERILCIELGQQWKPYNDEIAEKFPGPSKK